MTLIEVRADLARACDLLERIAVALEELAGMRKGPVPVPPPPRPVRVSTVSNESMWRHEVEEALKKRNAYAADAEQRGEESLFLKMMQENSRDDTMIGKEAPGHDVPNIHSAESPFLQRLRKIKKDKECGSNSP